MTVIDCVQGTPEWLKVRCGIPTASNFDKIINIDGKQSKQREKYLYQLAGERLIGLPEPTYQNASMQRGIELESEARQFYELVIGKIVTQVGFCLAEGYGASPDGLIDDDGCLEIKCPLLPTQVYYLIKGVLPGDYFQQTQGQLLVTGRKWLDFLSYYPGIKPLLIRVKPDKGFQELLKKELELFCNDLEEIINKIK